MSFKQHRSSKRLPNKVWVRMTLVTFRPPSPRTLLPQAFPSPAPLISLFFLFHLLPSLMVSLGRRDQKVCFMNLRLPPCLPSHRLSLTCSSHRCHFLFLGFLSFLIPVSKNKTEYSGHACGELAVGTFCRGVAIQRMPSTPTTPKRSCRPFERCRR